MAERVLVTGVDGFTGRYMAEALHEADFDVFGLSRLGGSNQIYKAELSDAGALKNIVEKVKPSYVIHLAAISFVQHGNTSDIYQTNIMGTLNLLDALLGSSEAVKNVLVASSANTYGNRVCGKISESTPASPANYYAASKAAMEVALSPYQNMLPITVVRPFNYTGFGQSSNFLVPKIVSHFAKKRNSIELGNVSISRDFSDVRDVVSIYRDILTCRSAPGEVFNVCSGVSHSLSQIIEELEGLAGYKISINVNSDFVRKNDVLELLGANEKLFSEIDYRHQYSLSETLTWMYSEMLKEGSDG